MIIVQERSAVFEVSTMEEVDRLLEKIKNDKSVNIISYSVTPSYSHCAIECEVKFVESDNRVIDSNELDKLHL